MKKITMLLAVIFTSFLLVTTSCKKSNTGNQLQLQLYYLGATRDYTTLESFRLYPDSGYSILTGRQGGTANQFSMRIGGLTSGNYKMQWPTDTLSVLVLFKGYKTYTTNVKKGWGSINISELGSDSTWVKGTFSCTAYNQHDSSDSLVITQGAFAAQYHY